MRAIDLTPLESVLNDRALRVRLRLSEEARQPYSPTLVRSLLIAVVLVFLIVVAVPPPVEAHPGGTDGNGCHTCRTNCTEKWGIPYGYYHRHNPVRDCFESPATTQPTPITTTTRPTTTTSEQTTTTRAPPRIEGDSLTAQLRSVSQSVFFLSAEIIAINELWESGAASYGETHASFELVALGVSELLAAIGSHGLDDGDGTITRELVEALEALELAASEVISGLEAPDSGQARREAVNAWLVAVGDLDSLAFDLTPTTTTTTTAAPDSTRIEVASTIREVHEPTNEGQTSRDSSGWLIVIGGLIVIATAAVAYWLVHRSRSST